MVAFDNTILSLLIFEDADLRAGPDGEPVERARERVLALVDELEKTKETVIVPAPALAECLVTEGAAMQDILAALDGKKSIRVAAFDERAAVELAIRLREARKAGDAKGGLPVTKSQMKFDRQIVAIACVNGARILYSDDRGVAAFARDRGLVVKAVAELPLPITQQSIEFERED